MANMMLTNEDREKFIRLCHAAQAAILAGKFHDAHLYFRHAAQIHPYSTVVWLGLAKVVDNDADRRVALENVLTIDPNHPEARQMLEGLNR
jgi:cytochrome c-type biogenesis protein CcmH/NrfG